MNIVSVLRGVKLAAFTSVLFALLLAFNAWSVTPNVRACFTEGPSAGGDLENGQGDVLSRRGKFDYERMQYRFEALSLWGFEGLKPDNTCLRYEVKNLSREKIEDVVWAVAGIEFLNIAKGDRIRWVNPSRPPYPAGTDMTKIAAFRKSSDLIRAYVPLTRAAASAGVDPGFAEFDIRDSMPDAVQALDGANLPIRRVTTVGPDRIGFLTSQFSNGTLAFQHSSAAIYEGQSIRVDHSIKFIRTPSGPSEIEISAPYIFALDSLTSPVDSDAVSHFATRIGKMRSQWNRPIGSIWEKAITAPIGPGVPALFIVKYPVTLRTQNEVFCLSVTSYSVLPVEAAANYCAAQQ